MVKALKYGDISKILDGGDSDMSPISLFYIRVLAVSRFFCSGILFDPSKIIISEKDACRLFDMFKAWFHESEMETDGDVIKLWMQMGPAISKEVVEGWVLIEDGYLYMNEDLQVGGLIQ